MNEPLRVGGQAVIEGVMMRSPAALTVAVRRPDGTIVVRSRRWTSLWERAGLLRRPFLRGVVVLLESLHNGIQSLVWSASQAAPPEAGHDGEPAELSRGAVAGMVLFSLAFAFGLFKGVPHLLTLGLTRGGVPVDSSLFHLIDGAIKLCLFVGYVWFIGHFRDVRRVFEYHGAEHKAIHAYEHGLPLSLESVRAFPTLHARCGTSFIMVVLLLSIFVFIVTFRLLPPFFENRILNTAAQIMIKIPLMLPVAGFAYEFIRLASKRPDNIFLRALSLPGLLVQHITTREPDDAQLEVALLSLRRALEVEAAVAAGSPVPTGIEVVTPAVRP